VPAGRTSKDDDLLTQDVADPLDILFVQRRFPIVVVEPAGVDLGEAEA
jgi:hypothetical protein